MIACYNDPIKTQYRYVIFRTSLSILAAPMQTELNLGDPRPPAPVFIGRRSPRQFCINPLVMKATEEHTELLFLYFPCYQA
jgi:hypothetical protein